MNTILLLENLLKNKKGIILIFVLIIISFCVGIVITINESSSKILNNVMDSYYEKQAAIYGWSALNGIAKIIEDDNNGYDGKDDDWYNIPIIPVKDGSIEIKVIPINSKIDINKLADPNKKIRDRYWNILTNMINDLGLEDINLAILKDWIDKDHKIDERGGDEDIEEDYYKIKNDNLYSLYELNYIKNFSIFYNAAKDYLTVLSDGDKININFAPPEVIKSFVPELEPYIDDIMDYRKENDFKDVSDLKELGIPDDLYLQIINYVTVKSSLFYVKIVVKIEDYTRYFYGVIKRDKGKTSIIRYIEGNNEVYF